jgi:hypothetical protein
MEKEILKILTDLTGYCEYAQISGRTADKNTWKEYFADTTSVLTALFKAKMLEIIGGDEEEKSIGTDGKYYWMTCGGNSLRRELRKKVEGLWI